MDGFSRHLAALDAAIDKHLRDPGLIRPTAGGPDLPVRVALERPVEVEVMTMAGLVRAKPWVELSLQLAPVVVRGDVILIGSAAPYEGWRIASAPTRPGDGRHWRAEVEPLGRTA